MSSPVPREAKVPATHSVGPQLGWLGFVGLALGLEGAAREGGGVEVSLGVAFVLMSVTGALFVSRAAKRGSRP